MKKKFLLGSIIFILMISGGFILPNHEYMTVPCSTLLRFSCVYVFRLAVLCPRRVILSISWLTFGPFNKKGFELKADAG